MHRRRVLAFGSVMVGFASYGWYASGDGEEERNATSTPVETADERPDETRDGTLPAESRENSAAETTHIGGSLNGRPHQLNDDLALVEKSNTRWLHAFLDVRGKYERDVTPQADPDVRALRRASQEMGTNLIVSLKWDFTGTFDDKKRKNVPPSGSSREAAFFEYATELLAAIDHPVDILVLGNEPIWETPDEDLIENDAPLMQFTRGLKDHLVRNYTAGEPQFLLGAFNRLYDDAVRNEYRPFYRQLFEMARSDDDIDGVDLHVHYDELQEAETMLTIAREEIPEGTITTTEFSPIWRYIPVTDEPLSRFEGGQAFADRYGYPGDMTVRGYFEVAKDDPRPRGEMGDFMKAMPWYNVRFVADMHDLLTRYGVKVGTFGFLQDVGIRHTEWPEDWRPFQINYLFQKGLIATDDGAHPHYLDDYRERT